MGLLNDQLVKTFRKESVTHGLVTSAQRLLYKLGIISVRVKGTIPTGPILLISNHPSGVDGLILQSVVQRKDYFYVAFWSYKVMGEETKKHILPIYRKHSISDILLFWLLGDKLPQTYGLSVNKHTKNKLLNRKSITKAAELISNGNIVMMFPQGHSGNSVTKTGWKVGVGFLLKQITNDNTSVVFAHIQGSGRTELLRYLRKPIKSLLFHDKEIHVEFSHPIPITSFNNRAKKTGKKLMVELERKYYQLFND